MNMSISKLIYHLKMRSDYIFKKSGRIMYKDKYMPILLMSCVSCIFGSQHTRNMSQVNKLIKYVADDGSAVVTGIISKQLKGLLPLAAMRNDLITKRLGDARNDLTHVNKSFPPWTSRVKIQHRPEITLSCRGYHVTALLRVLPQWMMRGAWCSG